MLVVPVDLAGVVVVALVTVVADQAVGVLVVVLFLACALGWHRQVVVDGEMVVLYSGVA